jgi:hypothetical protein
MEAVENHESVKYSEFIEQNMDAKKELNAVKVDRNYINGQHKCQDSLHVEHKNVQNTASDFYGTSGSDMIKENYSKQNAYHRNIDKSSMEWMHLKLLKSRWLLQIVLGLYIIHGLIQTFPD